MGGAVPRAVLLRLHDGAHTQEHKRHPGIASRVERLKVSLDRGPIGLRGRTGVVGDKRTRLTRRSACSRVPDPRNVVDIVLVVPGHDWQIVGRPARAVFANLALKNRNVRCLGRRE